MNNVFKVITKTFAGISTVVSEAAKTKRVAASVVIGMAFSVMGTTTASAATLFAPENKQQPDTTKWNKAHDLYVNKEKGTSSNLNAVAGKTISNDDQIVDIHGRNNEISDRLYRTQTSEEHAVHYDNDRVVSTDEPLKDTQTGAIMHDRDGNELKRAEFVKGDDAITFRGENGTRLKNVDAGVDDKDAVNVSQLKDVDGKVQQNTNRIGSIESTQQQHAQALAKESEERQKGYDTTSNRIGALDQEKADKSVVDKNHADVNARIDNEASTRAESVNDLQQRLDGKVERDEFSAEQKRRDEQAESDRVTTQKELNTKVNVGVYQNQLKEDQAKTAHAQETADNVSRETKRLDGVKADRDDVEQVSKGVDKAQNTSDTALRVGNTAYENTVHNSEDIQTLNSEVNRVDKTSALRAQRAETNANAYTDAKVNGLKHDIKKVDRDAKAGIAAAVALGQIQSPIHAGKGNVSVGAGNWKGSNAVAVGGGYRWGNDQWSAKGGVSFSDHDNALGGSVSYEF